MDEALRCYQRAAMLNPGDPVAPEKCGEIFERQGRLNDAAQTYLAVAEVTSSAATSKKPLTTGTASSA